MAMESNNQPVGYSCSDPRGLPFGFQETVEAEIVKVGEHNFYLYGKVEFKKRDAATGCVVQRCEAVVARAFYRDATQIVKKMSVGSKVLANFFFGWKRAEWLAKDVRPVESKGPPTYSCSRDMMATFSKIPAQVILKPELGVKLLACGAVLKLNSCGNYYDENDKKVDFRVAKEHLEQDAAVQVDANLCGSEWFITKVFLPVGSKQQLPLTVDPLPIVTLTRAEENEAGPLEADGSGSTAQEALELANLSLAVKESLRVSNTEPSSESVGIPSEVMGKPAFPRDEFHNRSCLPPDLVQICRETKAAEVNHEEPGPSNLGDGPSQTNAEVDCNQPTTYEAEQNADVMTSDDTTNGGRSM